MFRLGKKHHNEVAVHKACYLALIGSAIVVSACAGAVSPTDRALDGPWTTGHTISGLEMGLDLTWSQDRVTGTGGINGAPPPVHCGSVVIAELTTATLTATRPSSTEIRGMMTIGTSITMAYEGSLIATGQIDGLLVAADGTECGITLRQGLIP
jgi:hypothetical protein